MPVPALPQDLLCLILDNFDNYHRLDDRATLIRCTHVSKAFRAVARQILYRSIFLALQDPLGSDDRSDVEFEANFSSGKVWLYSERTRNLMRLLGSDSTLSTRVRHVTLAPLHEFFARSTSCETTASDLMDSLVDLLPNVDSFAVHAGSLLTGFHQLLASRAVTLEAWDCSWSDIAKLPKLRHLRIEVNSVTRQPFKTESIASLHIGQDIVFDHVGVFSSPPFDALVELSLPLGMLVSLDLARLHNLTHLRLWDVRDFYGCSLAHLTVATVTCPQVLTLTIAIDFSDRAAPEDLAWLAASLFPFTSDYILHPSEIDATQDVHSAEPLPSFTSLRRLHFGPYFELHALFTLVPLFGRCNRLAKRLRLDFLEPWNATLFHQPGFMRKVRELCEREQVELFFEF
ncbi:hypothetical protein JCM10212_000863 [Sporobolomyces blumeae]